MRKKNRVLPISNASAAAAFNGAWVYQISTTLQRGTAEIVYGVTQVEKAPMSAARIAKDQQVVEAVLRDKDPGWFQAQGSGNHPNKERTTQRAKRVSDATRTIRRARATRRVRVRMGEVTQGGNPTVHSNDRSSSGAQAFPQGEAMLDTD
jgi:hypothetical protein